MIKKEKDTIEYAFKKINIILSPDRSDFELFIKQTFRNASEQKIKSPYSRGVWFLEKRFLAFKMTPALIVLAIAVFVGLPEITGNSEEKIATEIIKDLEGQDFSFDSNDAEKALFEEIENTSFNELSTINFYEE